MSCTEMLLGKVIGNVWATRKDESLEGLRFLLIQPFALGEAGSSQVVVAADPLGAGVGETVIVAFGR
ncbi:MAG: EutN/CcmL family microcompartment protein, partial [Planctomycetota bacterium]